MDQDPLDHLLVPRPDDIVDRKYRVRERLGAGGMGIVFRVEHLHTGRTYALKVLWPALAATPEGQRRFEAEARAIGARSRCRLRADTVDVEPAVRRGVHRPVDVRRRRDAAPVRGCGGVLSAGAAGNERRSNGRASMRIA